MYGNKSLEGRTLDKYWGVSQSECMAKCYHSGGKCQAAVFLPAGGGCWTKTDSAGSRTYRSGFRVLACRSTSNNSPAPPPDNGSSKGMLGAVSSWMWTRDWA